MGNKCDLENKGQIGYKDGKILLILMAWFFWKLHPKNVKIYVKILKYLQIKFWKT